MISSVSVGTSGAVRKRMQKRDRAQPSHGGRALCRKKALRQRLAAAACTRPRRRTAACRSGGRPAKAAPSAAAGVPAHGRRADLGQRILWEGLSECTRRTPSPEPLPTPAPQMPTCRARGVPVWPDLVDPGSDTQPVSPADPRENPIQSICAEPHAFQPFRGERRRRLHGRAAWIVYSVGCPSHRLRLSRGG